MTSDLEQLLASGTDLDQGHRNYLDWYYNDSRASLEQAYYSTIVVFESVLKWRKFGLVGDRWEDFLGDGFHHLFELLLRKVPRPGAVGEFLNWLRITSINFMNTWVVENIIPLLHKFDFRYACLQPPIWQPPSPSQVEAGVVLKSLPEKLAGWLFNRIKTKDAREQRGLIMAVSRLLAGGTLTDRLLSKSVPGLTVAEAKTILDRVLVNARIYLYLLKNELKYSRQWDVDWYDLVDLYTPDDGSVPDFEWYDDCDGVVRSDSADWSRGKRVH